MTPRQALRFIAQHGVVLEAARGPVPSLLEAALGGRPRGSWWGHPRGKEFFWLTRAVRASRDGAKLTAQRALAALGSWTGGLTAH